MGIAAAIRNLVPGADRENRAAAEGAVPFALRFRAWWDGVPLEALHAGTAGAPSSGDAVSAPVGAGLDPALGRRGDGDTRAGAAAHQAGLEPPIGFWTPARIDMSEMLFGTGEIIPGGTSRTLDMIQAFGLGGDVNVLNVGAGLGGTAGAIAAKYAGWVTAYESDEILAAAAQKRVSATKSISKDPYATLKPSKVSMSVSDKAKIIHDDLETVEFRHNFFDCAFSRETLFTVAGKARLVESMCGGLKVHCPLVLTDYFVVDGHQNNPKIAAWSAREPRPVHFWSVAEAEEMLPNLGFDLRISEDMTALHRRDIFDGFEGFIERLDRNQIPKPLLAALLDLVELWGARVAAMDAGALRVHKLVALKVVED